MKNTSPPGTLIYTNMETDLIAMKRSREPYCVEQERERERPAKRHGFSHAAIEGRKTLPPEHYTKLLMKYGNGMLMVMQFQE